MLIYSNIRFSGYAVLIGLEMGGRITKEEYFGKESCWAMISPNISNPSQRAPGIQGSSWVLESRLWDYAVVPKGALLETWILLSYNKWENRADSLLAFSPILTYGSAVSCRSGTPGGQCSEKERCRLVLFISTQSRSKMKEMVEIYNNYGALQPTEPLWSPHLGTLSNLA
jgi:hypothetical protein